MPLTRHSCFSRTGYSGIARYVVDHDRLHQPLQREIADLFEPHDVFNRGGDPAADEDLPVLGLAAQPRRQIAHRADRRVVDPLGKADLAQCRVAARDPDPEADLAPLPPPLACSSAIASRIAIAIAPRARPASGTGTGSLKNTMMPSPEKWSSVPSEAADDRPQRAVVLAQEVEHLLRLGGLGEGGKAAQVAEHDDDVAAMGFKDVFIAPGDDQFRQLRRQKPPQLSDPLEFRDLR